MPDWLALALSITAILLSLWSLWLNQKTVRYWKERARQTAPMPCADGSYVHDFKGQTRCPACGFTGIRLGALIDGSIGER